MYKFCYIWCTYLVFTLGLERCYSAYTRQRQKGGSGIDYILIVGLVTIAIVFDLKTFRIPNFLIVSGLLGGYIYIICSQGIAGIRYSVIGMIIPVVLLFIFFVFRFIGAGDIKLLAVLGVFFKTEILTVIFLTMILTAIYGVGIVIKKLTGFLKKGELPVGNTYVHMSIPIGIGSCIFLFGGL